MSTTILLGLLAFFQFNVFVNTQASCSGSGQNNVQNAASALETLGGFVSAYNQFDVPLWNTYLSEDVIFQQDDFYGVSTIGKSPVSSAIGQYRTIYQELTQVAATYKCLSQTSGFVYGSVDYQDVLGNITRGVLLVNGHFERTKFVINYICATLS